MSTQSTPDHPPAVIPVALTIAGSDSGGGAGIQADLRTFDHLGTYGTSAITALTAQNPREVRDIHPVPASHIRAQLEVILDVFNVRAVKTGMLFNAEIIQVVADILSKHPGIPLVVDPVMIATSGKPLLQPQAQDALCNHLLPLATVITPNLPEAEAIYKQKLITYNDITQAAKELAIQYNCLAVIKGGHATDNPSLDTASDGRSTWELSSPELAPQSTHGTGCTLSAAIAAGLAGGHNRLDALQQAKAYVFGCLQNCRQTGPDLWGMTPPRHLPTQSIICRRIDI